MIVAPLLLPLHWLLLGIPAVRPPVRPPSLSPRRSPGVPDPHAIASARLGLGGRRQLQLQRHPFPTSPTRRWAFPVVPAHRDGGGAAFRGQRRHPEPPRPPPSPSSPPLAPPPPPPVTSPFGPFDDALLSLPISPDRRRSIREGLVEGAGFASSDELALFARDFVDRPEVLSSVLMTDFGFPPLDGHLARAALMHLLRTERDEGEATTATVKATSSVVDDKATLGAAEVVGGEGLSAKMLDKGANPRSSDGVAGDDVSPGTDEGDDEATQPVARAPYKSVIVNEKARQRKKRRRGGDNPSHPMHEQGGGGYGVNATSNATKTEYGLPPDYRSSFPKLASELDDFFEFMTDPAVALLSSSRGETPLRPATADVYLRHARLFFGWYVHERQRPRGGANRGSDGGGHVDHRRQQLSLFDVIPSGERGSARVLLDYVLWLRSERGISVSYEANVLRGLTKLVKFRLAAAAGGCGEGGSGDYHLDGRGFEDAPVVREMRKLHRDANRRQAKSPRSSEEEKKWISWGDYLTVVQRLKVEVCDLMEGYRSSLEGSDDTNSTTGKASKDAAARRKIATMYQHYLILAFFSCVPDRQRTVRELELDRTFLRDAERNTWIIKHGPDDYKTGGTYGDRPPLVLAPELTSSIDDFIDRWRPALNPSTPMLFVQPRTGRPLTQDSVYQIVARSCYRYTGRRTNPHLLRDMIVTHVRESSGVSEKELEALALYMGHSVQMQRTSYDRRTMTQKVAPAVQLMQNVNAMGTDAG